MVFKFSFAKNVAKWSNLYPCDYKLYAKFINDGDIRNNCSRQNVDMTWKELFYTSELQVQINQVKKTNIICRFILKTWLDEIDESTMQIINGWKGKYTATVTVFWNRLNQTKQDLWRGHLSPAFWKYNFIGSKFSTKSLYL